MSEFLTFMQLGFRHIVDIEALDHILFLVALAAIYRFRDVKSVLWVVTAFTVGHSVTLALSVTGLMVLPSALVEFLIPVTIVATGIENLLVRDRSTGGRGHSWRPLFAGAFGLVHGAGFANYLRAMFVDHIAVPLLGFNIGIEAGQLVVLLAIAFALALVDAALRLAREARGADWQVHRLRVIGVSLVVVAVGSLWAIQRSPW